MRLGVEDQNGDPAARASLIWMIGEYAEKITNAAELLETFVESFKDEPTSVYSSFRRED